MTAATCTVYQPRHHVRDAGQPRFRRPPLQHTTMYISGPNTNDSAPDQLTVIDLELGTLLPPVVFHTVGRTTDVAGQSPSGKGRRRAVARVGGSSGG